ncbi:MAG: hypothetical protein DDT28_00241 [Dehalococcoidia bacterium]|nr:hypothetical protein [Chloroflexota bacterium]
MRTLVAKNNRKAILVFSICLALFVFRATLGTADACADAGLEGHIEHIADDLCAISSSIRLISYASIGVFLVLLAQLGVSLFKKK